MDTPNGVQLFADYVARVAKRYPYVRKIICLNEGNQPRCQSGGPVVRIYVDEVGYQAKIAPEKDEFLYRLRERAGDRGGDAGQVVRGADLDDGVRPECSPSSTSSTPWTRRACLRGRAALCRPGSTRRLTGATGQGQAARDLLFKLPRLTKGAYRLTVTLRAEMNPGRVTTLTKKFRA